MKRLFRSSPKALNLFIGLLLILLSSCSKRRNPLGSAKNPVKFFFLPSMDAQKLADKGHLVEKYLNDHTPYRYKVGVPASYVAVIEAFGTQRADIATLSPFTYLLAHEKFNAHAVITPTRFGSNTYRGQIVVRTDSKIKTVKDLEGKKFAFVDPTSTSGFLLPSKVLKDAGVHLKETVFAQRHDNVIMMVYQKQVDAGATFYIPDQGDGKIQDARKLVLTQFPDVGKVVRILALTDSIPNDPIVVRDGLSPALQRTTVQALLQYMETAEGKSTLNDLYGITGMVESSDAHYDAVKDVLTALGKTATELIQ
jgi:phosphonate transport system substrate-binding protein